MFVLIGVLSVLLLTDQNIKFINLLVSLCSVGIGIYSAISYMNVKRSYTTHVFKFQFNRLVTEWRSADCTLQYTSKTTFWCYFHARLNIYRCVRVRSIFYWPNQFINYYYSINSIKSMITMPLVLLLLLRQFFFLLLH